MSALPPNSGHVRCKEGCPLSANSELMHYNKLHRHLINSTQLCTNGAFRCVVLSAEKCRAALFHKCRHTLTGIMGRDDACKCGFLDRQAIINRRIHAAMDCRAAARVSGGFVASVSARSTVFAKRSELGTTRLIKPRRAASVASNVRPVKISSMAAFRPTLRGNRWVPPKVGMIPILTSALEKEAVAAASAMWVASTSSHPPPNANPFTAAIIGLGKDFDAPSHLMTRAHEVRDCLCRASPHVALECRYISSRAKSAARPGDDYSAYCLVKLNAVQGSHNRENQFVAQSIEFFGSV